jgi:LCP family protein required for cell wall assembly
MNIRDDDYNKINSAYMLGGPNDAVQALNRNLDLQIEDYATFNWKAVADGINILGGIDVELSQEEFYYMNAFIAETVDATGVPSTQLKAGGMQHLDGVQAVAYGRLRLMDSDYMRTERQRKVIQLAFEKVKQADFATLQSLIGVVLPQLATSVDVQDMLYMASHVSRYHIGGTAGFPETRGERRMGKRGFCVIPRTLESNVESLHANFFGDTAYEPSDTVKEISNHLVEATGMDELDESETAGAV